MQLPAVPPQRLGAGLQWQVEIAGATNGIVVGFSDSSLLRDAYYGCLGGSKDSQAGTCWVRVGYRCWRGIGNMRCLDDAGHGSVHRRQPGATFQFGAPAPSPEVDFRCALCCRNIVDGDRVVPWWANNSAAMLLRFVS